MRGAAVAATLVGSIALAGCADYGPGPGPVSSGYYYESPPPVAYVGEPYGYAPAYGYSAPYPPPPGYRSGWYGGGYHGDGDGWRGHPPPGPPRENDFVYRQRALQWEQQKAANGALYDQQRAANAQKYEQQKAANQQLYQQNQQLYNQQVQANAQKYEQQRAGNAALWQKQQAEQIWRQQHPGQ